MKKFLEHLCCDLKRDNLFIVPRVNIRGGLALFWKNGIVLEFMNFSPNHIDAMVNLGVDDAWRFIGFYRAPETSNQEHS